MANNIVNRIVEELLLVIPLDYFKSEEFIRDCSNSIYAPSWNLSSLVKMTITLCDVRSEKDKIEQTLNYMGNLIFCNGPKVFYKFILFLVDSYCRNKNVKICTKGLRIAFREIGINDFSEIDKYAKDVPLTAFIINELEKWDDVKSAINKLEKDCLAAENTIDFQNVGNSCRTILLTVGKMVYNPSIHPKESIDGIKIGKADTVEMISSFIRHTLPGSKNEKYRSYAQATNDLANMLTHKTTATRKDMMITVSATINLVYLVGVLGDRFFQSEIF